MSKVSDKLLSARFWVVLMFTFCLCYMAGVEPSVRDAFFALAGGVIRDYFTRTDRVAEQKEVKPNG